MKIILSMVVFISCLSNTSSTLNTRNYSIERFDLCDTVIQSNTNHLDSNSDLYCKKICFKSDTIEIMWNEGLDEMEIMSGKILNRRIKINSKIVVNIDSILLSNGNRQIGYSDSIRPIEQFRYVSFIQNYFILHYCKKAKSINILLFDEACQSECYSYYVISIYFQGTILNKIKYKLYESKSGIPKI